MTGMDAILVSVLVISFALLVSGPVRNNKSWSATVTPLASIIGSGFLVSVPLLASAIGVWAVVAIALLTALAFLMGGAIRYNISNGEPVFDKAEAGHPVKSFEMLSHLALIAAYFISVTYYLVLLAAFGMKLLPGGGNPVLGKSIATVLISAICLVGATKGLAGVEKAEKFTVSANLAAIAALLVSLMVFGVSLPGDYSWSAAAAESHPITWDRLRFLMGLLIVVQGFETTRFMGDLYSAEMRIKAMKRAQIVSSVVYIVFFILMIPLFPYFTSSADVAAFIDVIERVTPWLPFIVTTGALASQFSASVADSIGASGLVSNATHESISTKHAYIVIGAVAICVIWATDVVSIVTLASRAFALFYSLQCVVAMLLAQHKKQTARQAWFGLLALVAFGIAVLGIPAGG